MHLILCVHKYRPKLEYVSNLAAVIEGLTREGRMEVFHQ